MQGTTHTQSISPHTRLDTKTPTKDSTIKHGVVAYHHRVCPVERIEPRFNLFMCATRPLGLVVVNFNCKTDYFKLVITYVGFGCDLAQAKLLVIVRLEINYD